MATRVPTDKAVAVVCTNDVHADVAQTRKARVSFSAGGTAAAVEVRPWLNSAMPGLWDKARSRARNMA
jgi:hypothetical protein